MRQISPNGRHMRVIAETGRPNGLAVARDGFIWVAESANSALLRMTLDGKVEVVATECEGYSMFGTLSPARWFSGFNIGKVRSDQTGNRDPGPLGGP